MNAQQAHYLRTLLDQEIIQTMKTPQGDYQFQLNNEAEAFLSNIKKEKK